MSVNETDKIIDELLCGDDGIVFNLVSLIRGRDGARIFTDAKSYLTAQSDAALPIWIYTNKHADERTQNELFSILSAATEECASLSVNAQEGFTQTALKAFADKNGFALTKHGKLNVYYIQEVRDVPPVGKLISADSVHEQIIATLIQQAAIDDNDGELTDEQAMKFAKTHSRSGNLFLWEQGGIVVSMARIVRYGGFARITSVVTERAARGNGYAKMLVGSLSKSMLADGLTPVLYARAENPSSNRCYQNVGFIKAGEICEFKLIRN